MKNTIKTLIMMMCAGCIVCTGAFALDMSAVKAYPVPYNPARGTLTIDGLPTNIQNRIQIFDINGDLVFDRSYPSSDIKWGGRNNSGKVVTPALYIIKVISEDDSGGYGKKLIRILVDYK